MQEIGSANIQIDDDEELQKKLREEYYVLELEMEKYNNVLVAADEYIQELNEAEQVWEEANAKENRRALIQIRKCMPVNIKNYSEEQLITEVPPNGQHLPKVIAKKFKRCNVLQLIRMDPSSIQQSHPAILENFRVTGLTLTERRAVYCHLTESKHTHGKESMSIAKMWEKNRKDVMVDRKFTWYNMMRDNFKSSLSSYEAHVLQCGPPDSHTCDLIGNQCPVRANTSVIDYYAQDYGYPDGEIYQQIDEVATVSSLSVNPEKDIDPKQLSKDRVKEEVRNQKRLAYEEWKRTEATEFEEYSDRIAIRNVKVDELERQIEQCKQDQVAYSEERQQLKRELIALPKGSGDRLSIMKRMNASQTKCADTKRASVLACEELDKLKEKKLELDEKDFVCSVPKPEWGEHEEAESNVADASPRSLQPSPTTEGDIIGITSGREALMDMVSPIQVSRKGGGQHMRSFVNGGGGLGAVIQGQSARGGSGGNHGKGGLIPPPQGNILHKMKAREEESIKREQMRKAAEEKARIEGVARAERRQEKEARLLEEACQKEESERKEHQMLELLAIEKEEEESNRKLAQDAERRERLCQEEEEKAAESNRMKNDKIAEFQERAKNAQQEVDEYEEKLQLCKQEEKELPRGSKDRLAKMKEINMYQQKSAVAKKATKAAEAELQSFLNPDAVSARVTRRITQKN